MMWLLRAVLLPVPVGLGPALRLRVARSMDLALMFRVLLLALDTLARRSLEAILCVYLALR